MKNRIFILLLITLNSCMAQSEEISGKTANENNCNLVSEDLREYVESIVIDTTVLYFSHCGTPPKPSCDVLIGLEKEFKIDSAKFHFDRLKSAPYEDGYYKNYGESLEYLKNKRLYFCLLAGAAHSNPDIRVKALEKLYQMQTFKLKAKLSPEGMRIHKQMEQDVLKFLIYILENTQWQMNGGENLLAQGFWKAEIVKILNFICYGTATNKGYLNGDFTVNPTKLENWKKHIEK